MEKLLSDTHYHTWLSLLDGNLERVGLFYDALRYEKGISFLLMLPQSLIFDKELEHKI